MGGLRHPSRGVCPQRFATLGWVLQEVPLRWVFWGKVWLGFFLMEASGLFVSFQLKKGSNNFQQVMDDKWGRKVLA